MKLIVGLGNPGLGYENTRHNLGARALKIFAKENKLKLTLNRSLKSRIAEIYFGGTKCLLAVPATFMNLSGEAARLLVNFYKVSPRDLLVIHDDMDLELGTMRFKKQGSSGGHKGIASIIKALGAQDFNRLKLGIGKSFSKQESKDYVLSGFSKKENKILDNLFQEITQACQAWLEFGIDKSMNEFNKRNNS